MRRGAVPVLCLALVGAAGGARALGQPQGDAASAVERGHYLTEAGECAGCHTRKGGPPFAGGMPLKTSLGTLLSANITPDAQTGIGAWTPDQFYRAMHRGRDDRDHHLYPAMPYNYFTHVTREDSDAIFAYLRTVPAASNAPKRNQLPFPLNVRGVMSFWNGLFFHPGEFTPDPARSAEWNRGAYLVGGLSHCGGCHTPMNALGAPKTRRYLQGGTFEDGYAPDLTPNPRTGLGGWSRQEIVDFLKTGRNAHSNASAEMASVVAGSTSRLTDADLAAIATYLGDLPASPSAPVATPREPTMRQGEAVYAANCAMCHQAQGQGRPGVVALRGDAKLQQANPVGILHVILAGVQRQASATATPAAMPAFGVKLSDEDAAAVATYVRNAWGNSAPAASPSQVAALRRKLAAAANPSTAA